MAMITLKRWALLLAVAFALCIAGCGDKGAGPNTPAPVPAPTPEPWTPILGTFTDNRDNKEYKTVKLNKTTWMAQNLNYLPDSGISVCYDNSLDSCAKYGRLYNWTTAMAIAIIYLDSAWGGSDVGHQGICPAGWHLPSRSEWDNLLSTVGGATTAGKKLKSKEGWSDNGNGTDNYGFTALPGGQGCADNGCFAFIGEIAFWWTATQDTDRRYALDASIRNYRDAATVGVKAMKWSNKNSVRCVQNN